MNSIPARLAKYKPYQPSKWERRIDGAVGLVAPQRAEQRMLSRERLHRYRYLAASGNNSLPNAGINSQSGDTQQGNRERIQMMWNGIELIENSGLAWSIRTKMCDYICGTLRYQARTGDATINNEYEDYLRIKLGRGMDIAGRKTIRAFSRLIISGQVVKGDVGVNVVRDGDNLRFQGVEADCIGNPLDSRVTDAYVGGVHLTPWMEHVSYDIFRRNRMNGLYRFQENVPARDTEGLPRFMLCANPITFDDIRGRTVFKSTLRNIRYLESIREYELQALQWAGSQSGVYYTKSGELPATPFDDESTSVDSSGATVTNVRVRPNTIQALGIGEDVKMFQHDRPSPNVLAMFRETIRDIANGTGLSYGFIYDMMGLTGPAVRSDSNQNKRALITWKEDLRESFLDPVSILTLGNGIALGEIPPHAQWHKGVWMFPPHPTIDIGRESTADINERMSLLRSGAQIAGEEGEDIEDIRRDCSAETRGEIEECVKMAKQIFEETGEKIEWRECYQLMKPGHNITMSPTFESARAKQMEITADAAATTADANIGKAQAALDAVGSDEDLASGDGTPME